MQTFALVGHIGIEICKGVCVNKMDNNNKDANDDNDDEDDYYY